MAERSSYAAGSRYKFSCGFNARAFALLERDLEEVARARGIRYGQRFFTLYGKVGATWPALCQIEDVEQAKQLIRSHITQYKGWR